MKPAAMLAVAMSVLLAMPWADAWAGSPVSAKAVWVKKLGKVTVKGKTARSMATGSQVSIYDAASQILLYSVQTDRKRRFDVVLPSSSAPCLVRVEAGGSKTVLKVAGAAKSCKTAPACSIVSPAAEPSIREGEALNFQAGKIKTKKGITLDYSWSLGDGSADMNGASATHTFPHAGRYRVSLNVTDSTGTQCTDAITVAVAPASGTNPNGKVGERPAPSVGEGMQGDAGSYVVLPHDELDMQGGGSMVSLPFNPYIGYNSLGVQVIQKVKQKPQIMDPSMVSVLYSAASNPDDPVGGDSINSTSQNLFPDNLAGSNFDPLTTTKAQTFYIDGHNFNQAKIVKNELWDDIRQPYAAALGKVEAGSNIVDTGQSRFVPATPNPLTKPDQSIRGSADKAVGMRQMPGFANPYKANDPQQISAYNADARTFLAQFIPASSTDDQGRTNPFPLFRVEARDGSGNMIAKTDAVYTTASEVACRDCHAKGADGADDTVWRTPVTENELSNADGTPGPATGYDQFPPATSGYVSTTIPAAYRTIWPGAVHNRFDEINALNPDQSAGGKSAYNLSDAITGVTRDANGLRTDRVAESRWWNLTTNQACAQGSSSDCKLQIRLKFKEAADFAPAGAADPDSPANQDKAALFNALVMHDYMVKYSPGSTGYSVQLADMVEDKIAASRAQPQYYCSGHHMSQLKLDIGINSRAWITNRSDYSRTFHAFHGKLQAYSRDVAAAESLDGQDHKKGEVVRDRRGHPKMLGGRGWDSQHDDDNGVPVKNGVKTTQTYDTARNNWVDPDTTSDPNFKRLSYAEPVFPVGENIPMEQNCLKCHSGATQHAFRDVHSARGLKCDSCHGDMLAVGNVYSSDRFDANYSGAGLFVGDSIHFRRPWLDEPDCGSCHMGDGNVGGDRKNGYYSAGVMNVAYNDGDKAAATRQPMDARFAVMPITEDRIEIISTDSKSWITAPVAQALYRKSKDVHGSGSGASLACATCHGGSHTTWPNLDPNANDNVTSKQLQGFAGNIVECSVCHIKDDFKDGMVATDGGASNLGVSQGIRDGNLVNSTSSRAYLAGPHGMHPVNDPYWWKSADSSAANRDGTKKGGWHNDFAKKPGPDGEDQCAACHGSNHKGTRLSRTLVDRSFVNEKGKPVKVAANSIIGCNLCHSLKKSFTGTPDRNIRPKMHMDALMMMEPSASAVLGGGGSGGGGGGGMHMILPASSEAAIDGGGN